MQKILWYVFITVFFCCYAESKFHININGFLIIRNDKEFIKRISFYVADEKKKTYIPVDVLPLWTRYETTGIKILFDGIGCFILFLLFWM